MQEDKKNEIINIAKRLYERGLVVAKSGNISSRLDNENILITASGSFLGNLQLDDIVRVDLTTGRCLDNKTPSSELALHSLIYKNFSVRAVLHCHPPLINGYFLVEKNLKALTFETKLYLGEVPVIDQDTPTITKPELVIDALRVNNLVVLKNHGVVSVSYNLIDALSLVEALEEAVRVAAIARLFNKEVFDALDSSLKDALIKTEVDYQMFSVEHILAIVDLVNKDEFISKKGEELDLTVKLAIKLDGSKDSYTFNFQKGKIVKLDLNSNAPFVISADASVWKEVFLGNLDCFVAVMQGKMKLEGQLAVLSKWYVVFSRLFQLFKQVKFRSI